MSTTRSTAMHVMQNLISPKIIGCLASEKTFHIQICSFCIDFDFLHY